MVSGNREKFLELANKRVNNAIKMVRLIGNLSNKSSYSYKNEDVDAIFSALNKELRECKVRFDASSSEKDIFFKLEY